MSSTKILPRTPSSHGDETGMPVMPTLQALAAARRATTIVVTNQVSARLWPRISKNDLDFNYNPSTMGGAVPFALGFALAQPRREVIVVTGDGSLLMSLGSLVTVMDSGAKNLTVIVLDNGSYEVTGCQQTPARDARASFAKLATASGFPNVREFKLLSEWQNFAPDIFTETGPRFISLQVQPTPRELLETEGPTIQQQLLRLRERLRKTEA